MVGQRGSDYFFKRGSGEVEGLGIDGVEACGFHDRRMIRKPPSGKVLKHRARGD